MSRYKKWVLKVDISSGAIAGGSGGIYIVGDFDGRTFIKEKIVQNTKWIDYCKDFYAAQSWSNVIEEQGRIIWVAWMNNWKYAQKIPAKEFRGIMTMPREVELTSVIRLN